MPIGSKRPRRLSRPEIIRLAVDAASIHGWLCHRVVADHPDPHTGRPDGFPPLVLARDGRLLLPTPVFADHSLSVQQQRWVDTLERVPGAGVPLIGPDGAAELLALLKHPSDGKRSS